MILTEKQISMSKSCSSSLCTKAAFPAVISPEGYQCPYLAFPSSFLKIFFVRDHIEGTICSNSIRVPKTFDLLSLVKVSLLKSNYCKGLSCCWRRISKFLNKLVDITFMRIEFDCVVGVFVEFYR